MTHAVDSMMSGFGMVTVDHVTTAVDSAKAAYCSRVDFSHLEVLFVSAIT